MKGLVRGDGSDRQMTKNWLRHADEHRAQTMFESRNEPTICFRISAVYNNYTAWNGSETLNQVFCKLCWPQSSWIAGNEPTMSFRISRGLLD